MKVKLKELRTPYKLQFDKEYEVIELSKEGYFVIYNEIGEKCYYSQDDFIVTEI